MFITRRFVNFCCTFVEKFKEPIYIVAQGFSTNTQHKIEDRGERNVQYFTWLYSVPSEKGCQFPAKFSMAIRISAQTLKNTEQFFQAVDTEIDRLRRLHSEYKSTSV